MASPYPGAYDNLSNPSGSDYVAVNDHAARHSEANDAIEAIQAELGLDPAGDYATVDARIGALETVAVIVDDSVPASHPSTVHFWVDPNGGDPITHIWDTTAYRVLFPAKSGSAGKVLSLDSSSQDNEWVNRGMKIVQQGIHPLPTTGAYTCQPQASGTANVYGSYVQVASAGSVTENYYLVGVMARTAGNPFENVVVDIAIGEAGFESVIASIPLEYFPTSIEASIQKEIPWLLLPGGNRVSVRMRSSTAVVYAINFSLMVVEADRLEDI